MKAFIVKRENGDLLDAVIRAPSEADAHDLSGDEKGCTIHALPEKAADVMGALRRNERLLRDYVAHMPPYASGALDVPSGRFFAGTAPVMPPPVLGNTPRGLLGGMFEVDPDKPDYKG